MHEIDLLLDIYIWICFERLCKASVDKNSEIL